MNITTRRIQNSTLVARDADALADFYASALNLKPRFRDAGHWIQFDVNGHNFAIAGPREAAVDHGAVLVFEVDDLEAACAKFQSLGGALVSTRDMGTHGRVATLTDPAGNTVQCFQPAG